MVGLGVPKATIVYLLFLTLCHVGPSMAVLFSELKNALTVNATINPGDVLHAGKDTINITWALINPDIAAGGDYKTVKVLLCYAPVSQQERSWRKTSDELKKDKTCQFEIVKQPFASPGQYQYLVAMDVPSASYFVRAYALDASGTQVAYGQTTNKEKSTNIFEIAGVSGRTLGIDISAGVFSAFSVVALIYFYVVESKKRK